MSAKDRLYFKMALDFTDHAKIFPLSDAAFRCLVEAIAYSRRQETDGLLARRYAVARWSLEVLRELCSNDPQKPSLIEVPEGWIIHDYADMNDTAAEIQARRERNRKAGKQGGLAKAKQVASKSLSKSLSENVAEEEKEKEKEIGNLRTEVVTYVGADNEKTGSVDEAPAKPTPTRRGTRLPEGWMPKQSTIDAIKAEFPNATGDDIRRQHNQFADWAASCTTKAAVKLNWDAAWRTWMRRELVKLPTSNGAVNGKPSKARVIAELAARVREQEQQQMLTDADIRGITA